MNIEGKTIFFRKNVVLSDKINHDPIEPDFMTPYQDKIYLPLKWAPSEHLSKLTMEH